MNRFNSKSDTVEEVTDKNQEKSQSSYPEWSVKKIYIKYR